jgi:hypothetical protein
MRPFGFVRRAAIPAAESDGSVGRSISLEQPLPAPSADITATVGSAESCVAPVTWSHFSTVRSRRRRR